MYLQLHVQSVLITTKVVSSKPAIGEVYTIQHYVIKFVSDLLQVSGFLWVFRFPLGTLVSSTNKTDHHDITEILIVLSGIKHHNPNPNPLAVICLALRCEEVKHICVHVSVRYSTAQTENAKSVSSKIIATRN